MTVARRTILLLWAAVVLSPSASAQDWPHWRGPRLDGSAEVVGLPETFDREKNVRWATGLPGPGAGTPIVVGDRIFLTAADRGRDRLVALCVRRSDGEILWQKDAGSGYRAGDAGSRVAGGRRSTYASPSATTDGQRVVFFFGNGDLVAYDLEGEELWRRNVQQDHGDFSFQWTFSASPTLWEGRLYLPILQRDTPVRKRRQRGGAAEATQGRDPIESFLMIIDPENGKTLHRVVRPSPAKVESRESYATPIPYVGEDGRKEILIVGGDVITGHDPVDGSELWRWGTWNEAHRQKWWRLVPTPVVGDGMVLVCAPKRAPVHAIKLGGKGELDEKAHAWQSGGRPNPVSTDVPTPAYRSGSFYVLSDVEPSLSRVAAKDGKVHWTTPLSRDWKWRASPTVADGRVWCINHHGDVAVIDAESGKIVHQVAMADEDDDQIRASIVVAHGALFVRTNDRLFCIAGDAGR